MTEVSSKLYCHPQRLEQRLREVEPACRVVPERHARRVARALASESGDWVYNSNLPIWVDSARLADFDIVRDSVLVGAAGERLLLVDPDDRIEGSAVSDAEVLRDYWRLLYRAFILRRLEQRLAHGELTDHESTTRLQTWGPTAAREIRFVLEADNLIHPTAKESEVYRVFAAVFADRAIFAPRSLATFFPSLPAASEVMAVLAADFDPRADYRSVQPAGAANPSEELPGAETTSETELGLTAGLLVDDELEPTRLLRRARRAARLGNHVRAAILRMRAAERLGEDEQIRVQAAARSMLHDGLVARLQKILDWDYSRAKEWTEAMLPLLRPAASGLWPRAARVLYDLQKIAVDLERDISSVEPIEWLRSFGRQPLRRPLTRARSVILLHHLNTAAGHLRQAAISTDDRHRLAQLLTNEINRVEQSVRAELGPVMRSCLDEVGLRPESVLENVAREKLIAELLDRVCERGFLRIGDLRDAIARNQCKIPDLRGPMEFFSGDPLLRADQQFADELHGVYRRGEIYLRWIQRLTAVSFGTPVGRWLTRFIAIPFGGAFLTVEFAKYLAFEFNSLWSWLTVNAPARTPLEVGRTLPSTVAEIARPPETEIQAIETAVKHAEHGIHLTPVSLIAMLVLGFVILGLVHVPVFRAIAVHGLWQLSGWCRNLLVDLPLAFWRSPWVLAVRHSRLTRFLSRYFGPATLFGLGTAGYLVLIGADPRVAGSWGWFSFAVVALFINSPTGRAASDWLEEAVSDTWRRVRVNLIPGVLAWVQVLFREMAGLVERMLYAVDERLRFREGQAGDSLLVKIVLAAVWFPIAYTVRFAFTLLLEPQINPVKHFPVVTVSHKLLLPLIPSVATATGLSTGTVTLIIGGIPGIFGFIVWELKENWRLYAANRPTRQPPVILGHHGETMRGLLRPGFHSGTIPRQYRRLRRALELAETSARFQPTTRWTHELHEIEAALSDTVDRELVALLRNSSCWAGLTPRSISTMLGVQQVVTGLRIEQLDRPPFLLAIEHTEGRFLARIVDLGWFGEVNQEQQNTFAVAVSGLLEKLCAEWAEPVSSLARLAEAGPNDWTDRVAFWDAAHQPSTTPVGAAPPITVSRET